MRFSKFLSICVVVFILSLPACFAREWIPELESAEVDRASGLDFKWSPYPDSARRSVLVTQISEQAYLAYDQKNYAEALERARYANKVLKTDQNYELMAKCLAHIGRPVDAVAMLKKGTSLAARVEVYEMLGMYKQALKVCDLPIANVDSYLLKCNLMMKHGDREQAIKLAQLVYFNCTNDGQLAPEMVQFFNGNKLPLPETRMVPESQAEVMAMIQRLPHMSEPRSPAALQKLFSRKFSITGRSSQSGFTYSSDGKFEAPILGIAFFSGPDTSFGADEKQLSFRVNLGTTILKQSDIENLLQDLGPPTASEAQGLSSEAVPVQYLLEYPLLDSHLQFIFFGTDKRLLSFTKSWKCPAKKSREALENKKPAYTPPSLLDVQREISSFHYKRATRDLMIVCCNTPETIDNAVRLRALLSQCYELLKRPEVAAYVRAAPWRHLVSTIVHAGYDPDKFDLTLDTYMHRLWIVRGTAEKDRGQYLIDMSNVGGLLIYQTQAPELYAKVFDSIGPLPGNKEKKISPLPVELADEIEFHWAKYRQ